MTNDECRKNDEVRSSKQAGRGKSPSALGFRSSFVIRHSSLVIAAVLSLVIAGCGKKQEASPHASANLPAATVRVEVIQLRKLPLTEEIVGTVRTRQAVDLEAKLSGRILTLPVKLGQTVKEGDLLVTLATQEIQARLEQAEAALRQSETDFQRLTKLRTTGAAMQSELDTATFRQQSAHAAVAEAKALMAYAQITAPMSGVVARKDADVGDLAMPGKPLLRLEDPTNLRLEAEVPNSVLARVKPGAALTVRVDALGLELQGKVAEIAPVADPATRSVRVKLDLPPTPGLLPGQFGRVAVPTAEADFLLVPTTALVRRGQLDLVFVAREGKAQMRIVRTGRTLAAGVEVLSGLNPGESVVVEGAAELLDGQALNAKGGQ